MMNAPVQEYPLTVRRWAGRLRRRVAAVAALTSVAGLAVAVPPAQASVTPAPAVRAARADRAASPAAGVREVCATPERGHAACMSVLRTGSRRPRLGLLTGDGTSFGYSPADLRSAYGLPSSPGTEATVAVVDAYNDPDAEQDLQTYRRQYGLPVCDAANGCFERVNQKGHQGGYPAPDAGWAVEESLDVDMVSAICPDCHIILVEADSSSFADLDVAEDEAVALGAKYVSNSWGGAEYAGESSAERYFNHPGTVITVAGGDDGYDNYLIGGDTPNWPAASPYVTSVGGTTLTRDPGSARGWAETAWSPDPEATGSGCSLYETRPVWQVDAGCGHRMTDDVSAVANPDTGVAVYDTYGEGGWFPYGVGGTSAATPIIASIYALAGTPATGSYPASYPYINAGGLNDVTSGRNYDEACRPAYFCTAGPGYDGPTGLGTPDGLSAFTPVSYGTLSGTVTSQATGRPAAGATVTAGPFSASTNRAGRYVMAVRAGSYTVTARGFGFVQQSAHGVVVSAGQGSTQNFTLGAAPSVTVSGTVTDGSGQGWPMFAKITIAGDPGGPVYTNPFTGDYTLTLPGQASYAMTVAPLYPGYTTSTLPLDAGTAGVRRNVSVAVDATRCDAPGYKPSAGACAPVRGGLVAGVVTDANTGQPVNGATVSGTAGPGGESRPTADAAVPGGFYWLFAAPPGATRLTATATGYQAATATASVTTGAVTRLDWKLAAGRLTIAPASVSATAAPGQSVTQKVTFTNAGQAPVEAFLGTQAGSSILAGAPARAAARGDGAPFLTLHGYARPGAAIGAAAGSAEPASRASEASGVSGASGWRAIRGYPAGITAAAAATDPGNGDVYVVGGLTSPQAVTAKGYVYTPAARTWSAIAPLPQPLQAPMAAFIDGTLYLTGGSTLHNGTFTASAAAYAYTPGANTWRTIASMPSAAVGAMTAVLGGQLYVIGGCTSGCAGMLDSVYRYDPGSGTWATLASYPVPVSYGACAGLDGQVVCTGGLNTTDPGLSATYLYDPVANTWSRGADMPATLGAGYWGMSYTGANGDLEISGGVTDAGTATTNEAQAYSPVTNTWRRLPYSSQPTRQAAGACGFYQVGGSTGTVYATQAASVLPGYAQCDGAGSTPWLSVRDTRITVPAGHSVTVTVRFTPTRTAQPGTYTASLWAATDTPYPVQTVPVSLQVTTPAGWRRLSGTVTSQGTGLAGATVAFSTPSGAAAVTPAVQTGSDGSYQAWLPAGQVQVSAADDGYQPRAVMATFRAGRPATLNLALPPDPAPVPYSPAHPPKGATAPRLSAAVSRHPAAAGPAQAAGTVRVCPNPRPGYAACESLLRTGLPRHKGLFASGQSPAGYGPSDLQGAYDLPSAAAGKGETVAVVDAGDDPTAAADLATYRKQYGLPACTTANGCFEKVNQEGRPGSYPPSDASWPVEESLDIEMVSAACPNCHIILVEADTASLASLGRAEDEAVRLGARYVSNSYGSQEAAQETRYNGDYDHPGVAITASAGDDGYEVNFPAASPAVTSVGGTTLTPAPGTARGWAETAWADTGSGCSVYEPKPVWQRDPGCQGRTIADVSAVADPATAVAMFSYTAGGWGEVGGTSVASPLIAAIYALAGTPGRGTVPASYPYLHLSGLNDVTAGSNGTCTPGYLCTARPGYDGPTGLGTPDGVTAFRTASYGILTGTVTGATGPVAGAGITAAGFTATTSSQGTYHLAVPPGSYQVTVLRYGYAAARGRLRVAAGQTSSQDFSLTQAPPVLVSGTVTDGSGHRWPLYAKITVTGFPGAPARTWYTSPFTGAYSLRLPGRNSYTLTVTPDYPGYATTATAVTVGTAHVRRDVAIPVAPLACDQAAGYGYSTSGGVFQDFDGWAGSAAQSGWTNTDNNKSGYSWLFNPPQLGGGNLTGSGGYAAAAADLSGGATLDTSLVSPVFSLTRGSTPALAFDTTELDAPTAKFAASVKLSLDGGTQWQTIWQQPRVPGGIQQDVGVRVPVPQAAGRTGLRLQFDFTGEGVAYWAVGDVLIGTPACAPVPGGLVAGIVSDANTGQPVNGATVTASGQPAPPATSTVTGDPALPGGFYWLFSGHTGGTRLAAADPPYAKASATLSVAADAVTRRDWDLGAGLLAADAPSLKATLTLGGSRTAKVTFRNSGAVPIRAGFGVQAGAFTPLSRPSGSASDDFPGGSAPGLRGAQAPASASSWGAIASYPESIVNNAVAQDPVTGQVYSVGGQTGETALPGQTTGDCPVFGLTASAYVYDPAKQAWQPISPLPQPLESPAAAFVDGTLYVAGGFTCTDDPSTAVYAYTPGARSWTQVASLPTGLVAPAPAVLDGQLYLVGGCTLWACVYQDSRSVYRYDPGTGHWVALAGYPVASGISFAACAGIDGEIACAGGLTPVSHVLAATYLYDPVSNTWTQGADMPYPAYQMAYAGSGGHLQVAGGVTYQDNVTSQASQYDPASNTWSALPSLPSPQWGGGGACGMYVVGGPPAVLDSSSSAEVLPGYGQCGGGADAGWLPAPRGITLRPGQSATVAITLNAGAVSQPGIYAADLWATANVPYANVVIPVTLTVNPPKGWSLLSGTVTSSSGRALSGATVQVETTCTAGDHCGRLSYTLTTAADGSYQWWLPAADNDLLVIAAQNGYIQQITHATLIPGTPLTLDDHLPAYRSPPA